MGGRHRSGKRHAAEGPYPRADRSRDLILPVLEGLRRPLPPRRVALATCPRHRPLSRRILDHRLPARVPRCSPASPIAQNRHHPQSELLACRLLHILVGERRRVRHLGREVLEPLAPLVSLFWWCLYRGFCGMNRRMTLGRPPRSSRLSSGSAVAKYFALQPFASARKPSWGAA